MGIYDRLLKTINIILNEFEKQPVMENWDKNEICKKYPKFLSRFKLINLQFHDFHFRQTFMVQVLILFQSLKQPINKIQKSVFVISDKKKINKIRSKIYKILSFDFEFAPQAKKLGEDMDKESENSNILPNRVEGKWSKWCLHR